MEDSNLQTVSRAVAVLRAFEGGAIDLSLKELTDKVQLNKATVLRLARTLVTEGLLVHDDRIGLYRISFGCIGLARKLLDRDGLFDCALPFMERARASTNETVCLIVREKWDRVVTHALPSFQQVRFVLEVGDRRPINQGAAGICLTSGLTDKKLAMLFAHVDTGYQQGKFTNNSAKTQERLDSLLKLGWALGRGEWSNEAAGAAAPVFGPDNTVRGAISIVMPLTRADDEYMAKCGNEAKIAATATSLALATQHQ